MIDYELFEQLSEWNRSKTRERVWFAKGAGAHGWFRPYMSLADYTRAEFLSDPELETPVFTRFSLATGSRGGADTVRDNRGFAVRFYTQEGNYDFLGTSMPVFYISDPKKLPRLMEALAPSPATGLREPDKFWRFAAEHPEVLNLATYLYTDLGTMRSYRTMAGYGVLPQLWTGKDGQRHLVRCRLVPLLGEKTISANEAEFLAGFDPDASVRDLYETLESGKAVEYELQVQMLAEGEAGFPGHWLSPTVEWPEETFPYLKAGKLILNRLPESETDEVEGVSFSPGNLVEGISAAPHPLAEAAAFACADGGRYRLGEAHGRLKVNRSLVERKEDERTSPGPVSCPALCADSIPGYTLNVLGHRLSSMARKDGEALAMTIAGEILFLEEDVQEKILRHFYQASQDFGRMLAEKLGI